MDLATGEQCADASNWIRQSSLELERCYPVQSEDRATFGLFTRFHHGNINARLYKLDRQFGLWNDDPLIFDSNPTKLAKRPDSPELAGIAGNMAVVIYYGPKGSTNTGNEQLPISAYPVVIVYNTDDNRELGRARILAYVTEENQIVIALYPALSDDLPIQSEQAMRLISATSLIPDEAKRAGCITLDVVGRGSDSSKIICAICASSSSDHKGRQYSITRIVEIDNRLSTISACSVASPSQRTCPRAGAFDVCDFWFSSEMSVGDDFGNNYFLLLNSLNTGDERLVSCNDKGDLFLIDNDIHPANYMSSLATTGTAIWYLKDVEVKRAAAEETAGFPRTATQLIRYDPLTGEKKVVHEADDIRFLTASID